MSTENTNNNLHNQNKDKKLTEEQLKENQKKIDQYDRMLKFVVAGLGVMFGIIVGVVIALVVANTLF